MAGTFPFVFAYQAIAAPVVAVLLFFAWAFWKILEPGTSTMTQNPLVIGVSVGAVLISFVAVAAASVGGFYEGWRAGWLYGKGRALKEVLFEGPTFRRFDVSEGKLLSEVTLIETPHPDMLQHGHTQPNEVFVGLVLGQDQFANLFASIPGEETDNQMQLS